MTNEFKGTQPVAKYSSILRSEFLYSLPEEISICGNNLSKVVYLKENILEFKDRKPIFGFEIQDKILMGGVDAKYSQNCVRLVAE